MAPSATAERVVPEALPRVLTEVGTLAQANQLHAAHAGVVKVLLIVKHQVSGAIARAAGSATKEKE